MRKYRFLIKNLIFYSYISFYSDKNMHFFMSDVLFFKLQIFMIIKASFNLKNWN